MMEIRNQVLGIIMGRITGGRGERSKKRRCLAADTKYAGVRFSGARKFKKVPGHG